MSNASFAVNMSMLGCAGLQLAGRLIPQAHLPACVLAAYVKVLEVLQLAGRLMKIQLLQNLKHLGKSCLHTGGQMGLMGPSMTGKQLAARLPAVQKLWACPGLQS